MANKSTYLEVALLNEVLRGTNYVPPASVWVALYSTAPTDAGGGTEITTGACVRKQATFGAPTGSPSQCVASGDVLFPIATLGYTVVAAGIWDAETNGNLLYWNNVTNKVIGVGDQYRIPAASLTVSED
jgi:hypothetical protein